MPVGKTQEAFYGYIESQVMDSQHSSLSLARTTVAHAHGYLVKHKSQDVTFKKGNMCIYHCLIGIRQSRTKSSHELDSNQAHARRNVNLEARNIRADRCCR